VVGDVDTEVDVDVEAEVEAEGEVEDDDLMPRAWSAGGHGWR